MLLIFPRDAETWFASLSPSRRIIGKQNEAHYGAPIAVPLTGSSVSREEIKSHLIKWFWSNPRIRRNSWE